MKSVATVAAILVGLLHVYILVLEMFLWESPTGRRAFGLTKEFANASKTLAANQGLYNGFLAAGILLGVALGAQGRILLIFSLACVVVAGIYGGLTANKKIIVIQALPGALALGLVLLAG